MDFAVSEAMQDLLARIRTILSDEVFPLER